ncbi:MAG: dehydratase [Micrococcales bacterium]|nr:dehydratase [Micrococcales bacterium]
MSALVDFAEVEVGEHLPGIRIPLRRVDLVMYAGASGDFNPIHWNERIAVDAGLPNVIAHGMLTLAETTRVVTDWTGDPGAVISLSCRFTRPVPVPDDDTGAALMVGGRIAEKLAAERVAVELIALLEEPDQSEVTVLKQARAVVQL